MSEITISLLYLASAGTFGASRLPRYSVSANTLLLAAYTLIVIGLFVHSNYLYDSSLIKSGLSLSFKNIISMVGLELALISLIAAFQPTLRGITAGLLLLGAIAVAFGTITEVIINFKKVTPDLITLSSQLQFHILISLISYGLLCVGAIVAIMMLIQEKRLRASKLSAISNLFAPLETTEKLLFNITALGSAGLAITIWTGLTFVENLFAQHLAHKTFLSIFALFIFGSLLVGRFYAGWRGTRIIKLYLSGFILLFIAYFVVRLILEQVLNRSWS